MKNIFLDEANRSIERGGLEGDIGMIFKYGNFAVVEDENMTEEEKLKNGVEMLGIEVKNYEKRENRNRTKNSILGFLAILIMLVMLAVTLLVENLSQEGTVAICSMTFFIVFLSINEVCETKNDNRLVLFWIAYLMRILHYTELPTEKTIPVVIKMKRAISSIS
jgi:hypothetical protein